MNIQKQAKSKLIIQTLRYSFLVLPAILLAYAGNAQLKFTTVASSNEIGRNDYVQVQYVISNAKQIDQFSAPTFPDFQVIEGPSQSSGMSNINGNISQYESISFVLQPTKTGKFTISGASATIDGKPMKSNAIAITVSATGGGKSGGNNSIQPFFHPIWPSETEEVNREYVLRPGENAADVIKRNLFVKVQVSKNKCYVGEPIVATFKLYSSLRSESRITKLPSMNGFSVYDMVDPNKNPPTLETVNGKKFTVHIIRKTQLIPLQPGMIQLDPVQIDNDVYFIKGGAKPARRNNLLDDFFDNFMDGQGGDLIEEHASLSSKPVDISVEALPEKGKPADFSGAVGNFSVEADLENKKIAARDEATLKVTVQGSGNLPIVNAPQVPWPATIDGYDPAAKENVDKSVAPMAGSKIFEFTFSPKIAGDYTIPAIDFSYFDPVAGIYRVVKTRALNFTAAPAAKKKNTSPGLNNALAKNDQSDESAFSTFIVDHLEWIFAFLILSSLGIYLWRQNLKHRREENARAAAVQAEKERIAAMSPEELDPLLRAKRFQEYADYPGFYQELNRAAWKQLGEKLLIRSSELNKHNVVSQLRLKGWNEQDIIHLEGILNKCEMNLYTPDYSEYGSHQLLAEMEVLIRKL